MSKLTSSKANLRDTVYESVKDRLLARSAEIEEPERIREETMAKELGVSRTPVREALLRLGMEGVVNFQPRRGAMLMPVTLQEYVEWLKIRAELEAFAAREAALNSSQRDIDALREIFAPFNEDNLEASIAAYAEANVRFHAEVIRLAACSLLEKIWSSFGHRQMLKTRTIERLNRARASLRDHLALINAIEARNADLAAEIARNHVLGLLEQVQKTNNSSTVERK